MVHSKGLIPEHVSLLEQALASAQSNLGRLRSQIADAVTDREHRSSLHDALARAERLASASAASVTALSAADRTLSRITATIPTLPLDQAQLISQAAAQVESAADALLNAVLGGSDPGRTRAALSQLREQVAKAEAMRRAEA